MAQKNEVMCAVANYPEVCHLFVKWPIIAYCMQSLQILKKERKVN